ncbi:phosphoribosylformylglycinamidine synthase subunit PurS [Asaia astilbis]|uniref:phosphoribosylformylglycinamidine synthase subunit PurS n=1 Tax=Asaia astilbis TaxID=610244 RepID=UPI00046EFF08|nr:phosphoribosylformylglycinamidine synthase subunit PurS [Asaia astilbis]
MKIRVNVMLKEGVLDPQGKAIGHALEVLGFANVGEVRVGKTMELEVATDDQAAALAQGEAMARELLANLVIEDFAVEVVG